MQINKIVVQASARFCRNLHHVGKPRMEGVRTEFLGALFGVIVTYRLTKADALFKLSCTPGRRLRHGVTEFGNGVTFSR